MADESGKRAGNGDDGNRWRVLVCGSRDGLDGLAFAQVDRCVGKVLEELGAQDAEIVSGAARGGDAFGEQYAKAHGLPVARFPAEWDKHGKSAGFRRNLQMVDYLKERPGRGVVIAFWNGESHGTMHTASKASGCGIPVYLVTRPWTEPRRAEPDELKQGPPRPAPAPAAPRENNPAKAVKRILGSLRRG